MHAACGPGTGFVPVEQRELVTVLAEGDGPVRQVDAAVLQGRDRGVDPAGASTSLPHLLIAILALQGVIVGPGLRNHKQEQQSQ